MRTPQRDADGIGGGTSAKIGLTSMPLCLSGSSGSRR